MLLKGNQHRPPSLNSLQEIIDLVINVKTIYQKPTEEKMPGAYLQINLDIKPENREAATRVYQTYREPFLDSIKGAKTKELLVRDDDVQVLHGFDNADQAKDYLQSNLFKNDVVRTLQPLLSADPDIRIYICV
jgi:hypothetical protein